MGNLGLKTGKRERILVGARHVCMFEREKESEGERERQDNGGSSRTSERNSKMFHLKELLVDLHSMIPSHFRPLLAAICFPFEQSHVP